MLDTLKFAIPLTDKQYKRITDYAFKTGREQWALFDPKTGELRFRRILGLAETDQESFHREIRWDIPGRYIPTDCFLTVEFSLPKFWYGHNISLLYDPYNPLLHFKKLIEQNLGLTRLKLPFVDDWILKRADLCYAWKCPSQQVAQAILDSLKHLNYPRKKPSIYPTGILFAGRTYSLKFYLKWNDFRVHDMPILLKDKASLEWINYLENKALGVLRTEATLRSQYLKTQGIQSIKDLMRISLNASKISIDCDSLTPDSSNEDRSAVFMAILQYNVAQGILRADSDGNISLSGHRTLTSPIGTASYTTRTVIDELLQYFLSKFIGDMGMQLVTEVESKLMERYKSAKAFKLMSFWLYVQRFGSEKARQVFGVRNFNNSKSDLKKAGVSLIEQNENVIKLSPGFFQDFKLEVPSNHVTNAHDDFRDSENLLNLKSSAG